MIVLGSKHSITCTLSHVFYLCLFLYRWFLGSVASAFLSTLSLSLLSFVFFVLFFASRPSVCYLDCGLVSVCSPNFHSTNGTGTGSRNSSQLNSTLDTRIHILSYPVPDQVFPVLAALNTFLTAIAAFLLGQLLGFHLYLMCQGLSTYDYIIRKRELSPEGAPGYCSCSQCKVSTVHTYIWT
jgi:hypothetical protein